MKDSSKYRWIFRVKKKKSFVPLTLLKRALKLRGVGGKAPSCHREKCCLSEGRASFTRGFSVQGAGAALGKLHELSLTPCIGHRCFWREDWGSGPCPSCRDSTPYPLLVVLPPGFLTELLPEGNTEGYN